MSFAADTIVHTLQGCKFLGELEDAEHPTPVLTWTGSRISVGHIRVTSARRGVPLCLELDDGHMLFLGPDDMVYTLEGFPVPARELRPETSLLPIYFREDSQGYPTYREPGTWHEGGLTHNDRQRYRKLNRLVAEWKLERRLQPGDRVIHLDRNKQNCSPDNIEIGYREPKPTTRKAPMVEALRAAQGVLNDTNHKLVSAQTDVSTELFSILGLDVANLAVNGIFVSTDITE